MQCYTDLTPPTAVTSSVALPFISSTATNLILARSSLLQVFAIKSALAETGSGSGSSGLQNGSTARAQRRERSHLSRLVLISEFEVSGTVTALARVKSQQSKSGGELLLVSIRNARLSLVEWDPETYSISTVSIHYYERDDLQGPPWAPALSKCDSILTIDPRSRCAALKFGARSLAILPLNQVGDDLAMDDLETDFDSQIKRRQSSVQMNGDAQLSSSSHSASFVLSLLQLDPALTHPIHLSFLHEYREPTIGVLSSRVAKSSALLQERRDIVSYTVYTLDLEQQASTPLVSISGLPYDLHKIVSLPPPIGGALLIGNNEIVHIGQAGKANGIAVNHLAQEASSYPLVHQEDLSLRLEGCMVEQLGSPTGELLMITRLGELVVVGFKLDGRSVSGLMLHRIAESNGGGLLTASASCASIISPGRIFVGSRDADALVVGWSSKSLRQQSRRRFSAKDEMQNGVIKDEEEEEDSELEDDLYRESDNDAQEQPVSLLSAEEFGHDLTFKLHDRLLNLAPLRDVTLVKSKISSPLDEEDTAWTKLDLVGASGQGRKSNLTRLSPTVCPSVTKRFDVAGVARLWAIHAESPSGKVPEAEPDHHNVLILSMDPDYAEAVTNAYTLDRDEISLLQDCDFEPEAGTTVEVGTLLGGLRIVQVLRNELRSFDGGRSETFHTDVEDAVRSLSKLFFTAVKQTQSRVARGHNSFMFATALWKRICIYLPCSNNDMLFSPRYRAHASCAVNLISLADFGLAQIIPLSDDLAVVAASFVDTFLLLIGEDGRLSIFRADDSGDLEEIQITDQLFSQVWQSGSLFDDVNNSFRLTPDSDEEDITSVLMFLLASDGGLQIFRMPNLDHPVFLAPSLSFLPPFLSSDFTVRRSNAREALVELLVAELGDKSHKSPFLVLRSKQDDLIIYFPYHDNEGSSSSALRFRKVDNYRIPKAPQQEPPESKIISRSAQLRIVSDIGGHFAVFMPGYSASFIFKAASSNPKVIEVKADHIPGLARVRATGSPDTLAYPGKYGRLTFAQLRLDADFSTGWSVERMYSTSTIKAFKYHEPSDRFVIAIGDRVDFKLPHDEFHPEWDGETTTFLPQVDQDTVHLVDPSTWAETDYFTLDAYEGVMCIENVSMETSENTHSRSSAVAIGTALTRGEDISTQGAIYIMDVIPVVPEPGYPETGWKFKALARHKDKGAVTAISQVGTEGFLLAAHGQKCMVRGLKEDSTLLPVAFMDAQCYISVAKELRGTGLCILGDASKGIWLAGYTEDPYHLKMFGKSARDVEVATAEFLPDGRGLCVLIADADTNIHVLRFDPHNPKSLSGQHLLHLSSFHTGLYATKMMLLPRSQTSWERFLAQEPTEDDMQIDGLEHPTIQHQILLTSQTGAISLITPLPVAATGASSDSFRSLTALQSYLSSTLPHPLGLSPKAYRNVEVDMSVSGRAMLDGNVLRRWTELGSWKKAEALARTGGEGDWEVRALLEGVLGRGLGFF